MMKFIDLIGVIYGDIKIICNGITIYKNYFEYHANIDEEIDDDKIDEKKFKDFLDCDVVEIYSSVYDYEDNYLCVEIKKERL